jgi:hypothetical protein
MAPNSRIADDNKKISLSESKAKIAEVRDKSSKNFVLKNK